MHALTVRWSLASAPDDIAASLRSYVADTSYARFDGKPGLRFKTWRMREGEWFEGCYVFESSAARATFQEEFTAGADQSPVSVMVGAPPVLIEPCEVVSVVEGGSGFLAAPAY